MRTPTTRDLGSSRFDLQMTPMIDVIFLLLVFFLATAGLALPEALLPTYLPSSGLTADSPLEAPDDVELIQIKLRGREDSFRMLLNDRPITTMIEMREKLRTLGSVTPDAPVILDIGPDVRLGRFVDLYDQCRQSGLWAINFAVGQRGD
ncbi:Biopolymer transport protein ExbD/TolR [Planctomycetes bacterium Pan216]|uniref:Biopolymer transport protein ExbD/TolR n=1 Tax=Kolteria novifilia TaxID=2527975 RepID=A0A518BA77_9BACT|nr:Biopolymer transport protein ExbD/TolR [Planctomycetes bacterium Pan216]